MSDIRVQISEAGIRRAMGLPAVRREVEKRADAIKDACNAQSSWGGYESGPESSNWRASANVWIIGPLYKDEARSNRMIRNLDAGR